MSYKLAGTVVISDPNLYTWANNGSWTNATFVGNSISSVVGTNGWTISMTNSNYIQIATASVSSKPSEKFRFTSDGNFGIGTTNPTNKFEVHGATGQLLSVSDSFTGTIFAVNDISGVASIEVFDSGLVSLAETFGAVNISTGTQIGSNGLTVWTTTYILSLGIGTSASGTVGEIRASNEITAYYTSDERLKTNITIISNPIEKIKQIRGVYFDWIDEHISKRGGEDGYFVRKHDVGTIAQEVEKILPEIVGTRDDGYKAVRYEKLVPLLIEAIKEQQITIEQLKIDIENIKRII